jgi:hypothetical protein
LHDFRRLKKKLANVPLGAFHVHEYIVRIGRPGSVSALASGRACFTPADKARPWFSPDTMRLP